MLYFDKQISANIDTEAVLFEVDCVGRFLTHPTPRSLIRPEVLAAYESAFNLGQIEPGNPLTIASDPTSTSQRYTFLLPTRVHWKGKCRASTLDNGMAKVFDQVLCDGIKSLAIPKIPTDDEAHWPLFKQRLLHDKKSQSEPHVGSKLPNSKNGTGVPASGDASERKGPKPKEAGDSCRYCQKPLEQREAKKHKAGAAYWYAWYLYCSTCRRMYHVDAAKVFNQ